MNIKTIISPFKKSPKSFLIGFSLVIIQSMPIYANTVRISPQIVHANLDSSVNISDASLLGGAYFMVLIIVGYAIKWYFDLRKNKHENAG